MANLGLEVLDRTVQETNRWLKELMQDLKTDNRQDAYHALRAVLFALRDRQMERGMVEKMFSSLPDDVRALAESSGSGGAG